MNRLRKSDKRRSKGASSGESQGSVWTSFSDLFTSVAIIFLVMFVVAMIRLSLSTMQSTHAEKNHKEFLAGNVPDEVKTKVEQHQSDLKEYFAKIDHYKETLAQRSQEIESFAEGLQSHQKVIDRLLQDQQEKSAAMVVLNETLKTKEAESEAKDKRIENLQQSIQNKLTEVEKLDLQNKKSIEQIHASNREKIQQLERQAAQQIKALESKLRNMKNTQGRMAQRLADRQERLSDLKSTLASTQADVALLSGRKNLRQYIAGQLANRFADSGINVDTNPQNGNVTLFMDDAFLFVNDSFVLTETIKDQLRRIVPLYADELFGHPAIREVITAINIVGHASPRYNRSFVDVQSSDTESFDHNLKLSLNRAREISNFIFSDEVDMFQFRSIMRKKIHVVGRSFAEPIRLTEDDRVEPDREVGRCGDYNCKKSRRVEISFSLAEEVDDQAQALIIGGDRPEESHDKKTYAH